MFCMHWFIRIALFRLPTAGLHQKMVSICYAGLLLAPLSVARVSVHFHGLGDDDGDVNESGKKASPEQFVWIKLAWNYLFLSRDKK